MLYGNKNGVLFFSFISAFMFHCFKYRFSLKKQDIIV